MFTQKILEESFNFKVSILILSYHFLSKSVLLVLSKQAKTFNEITQLKSHLFYFVSRFSQLESYRCGIQYVILLDTIVLDEGPFIERVHYSTTERRITILHTPNKRHFTLLKTANSSSNQMSQLPTNLPSLTSFLFYSPSVRLAQNQNVLSYDFSWTHTTFVNRMCTVLSRP